MEEGVEWRCYASKVSWIQGETSKNCAAHNQKFNKKVEMKEVQCYCCQKFGHYARDFYFNKEYNWCDKGVTQFAHAGGVTMWKILEQIHVPMTMKSPAKFIS